MLGSSSVAAQLAAFQEGLSSINDDERQIYLTPLNSKFRLSKPGDHMKRKIKL
jgi:hypothetical protein